MSELPEKENCVVDRRKVTDYLLNTSQMPAAAKARFFISCGFSSERWEDLSKSLIAHGQHGKILRRVPSDYGVKYEIEGPLVCPDGRSPIVRSVWQIDKDGLAPRLITAYPIFK
jgi:hypothetical protein